MGCIQLFLLSFQEGTNYFASCLTCWWYHCLLMVVMSPHLLVVAYAVAYGYPAKSSILPEELLHASSRKRSNRSQTGMAQLGFTIPNLYEPLVNHYDYWKTTIDHQYRYALWQLLSIIRPTITHHHLRSPIIPYPQWPLAIITSSRPADVPVQWQLDHLATLELVGRPLALSNNQQLAETTSNQQEPVATASYNQLQPVTTSYNWQQRWRQTATVINSRLQPH